MKKTLAAYFSASGTTRKVAEMIAEAGDCALYEITPKELYTNDDLNWMNKKSRSSVEMSDKKIRPQITDTDAHIKEYDTIILGFPIWWYVAPTIVNTFLEKYDLLAVCSNQFHKITDFAYILNQLLMVIGLEKSLHFNKSLIHYQDYIMYCGIKKIGREGHIQYFCMPELLEVFRYDHKYGTSFAYSKRIALELASVTAAAQKLGIHRNTMEYRLRKFNDLSGISNYTADIVERLLFTYKILDLYPEILEEKDIL